MIKRYEKGVFFFTLFAIILQTGKHFWPSFAYVNALRVDYLSPTLYLSDISIGILFLFYIWNWFRQKNKKLSLLYSPLFLGTLAVLCLTTLNAVNIPEALYGDIRVIEFIFFGYYTYRSFGLSDIKPIATLFAFASLLVSLLALVQFFLQQSVGNIFYFLGERTFSASTLGIATFPLHGQLILRPYATFSHPNVLAFFLLVSLVFIAEGAMQEKDLMKKIGLWIVACIASGALLVTFSRVTLLAFLLLCSVFCFTYLRQKKARVLFLIAIFTVFCFGFSFLIGRLSDTSLFLRDFSFRESLVTVSLVIIQKNPFFGVGINNFFIHELPLQKTLSPIFLQPVHNIYLLVFAETGLIGFLLFIWFLIKTFWRQKKAWRHISNFERNILVLLLCALGIGLSDHFLLTLQQGQLLFSFLLGLTWSLKGQSAISERSKLRH